MPQIKSDTNTAIELLEEIRDLLARLVKAVEKVAAEEDDES